MAKFSVSETALPGVLLVKPRRLGDARGYFVETYSRQAYGELGVTADFVQDNQSLSAMPGTLRGLHFQKPPFAQAKLVRVLKGSIFDVAVDLRVGSPHFGRWCGATLTADGDEQLFVPRGFAHGFVTLEPDTVVSYKVDAYYSAECDAGVTFDDPRIGVEWPWSADRLTLSAKDKVLPRLSDIASPFVFAAP
jgi:dTDP-4-dehydrorhamnose 3,5-epimerase